MAESPDVYVAAFPCQPFSKAGSRKGFSDKVNGDAFFRVQAYIDEVKPKTFMLENVANLKHHDNGDTFKVILELLQKSGLYNIYITKL